MQSGTPHDGMLTYMYYSSLVNENYFQLILKAKLWGCATYHWLIQVPGDNPTNGEIKVDMLLNNAKKKKKTMYYLNSDQFFVGIY